MYIITQANDRPQQVGLRGFSAPPPPCDLKSIIMDAESSTAAIKLALKLNPVKGYVKGSPARTKLDEAFCSVPPSYASALIKQLREGKGPLEKCFRYRLARPTRQTMLEILESKAKKYVIEENDRKIEEYRKNTCERWKKEDMDIESVCRGSFIGRGRGAFKPGDPVKCQALKGEAERARTQDRIKGVHCP